MAILKAATRQNAGRMLKGFLHIWLAAFALLFLSRPELPAQTGGSKEYQIKAVFLFNFAQFVDWPSDAFFETQTPLIIGVLGDDPFDSCLDETVRDEKVNGHPLAVQRFHRVEDIKACQILFISRSETKRLEQILGDLKGRSILTVGDIDGFARRGGMIQFANEQNKIRFKINAEAAKAADLTISSKLLHAAEIVEP